MNSVILTIVISSFTPTSNTILAKQYIPLANMTVCLDALEASTKLNNQSEPNITVAYMCEDRG